jgi:hypothetical protein
VHVHEERLNHDRPNAPGVADVVENALQRDARAFDEAVILFRARFELRPDFAVVTVEKREGALHVRTVEESGIGDDDDLRRGTN